MIINTCSGAMSFAKELETKSAQFYEFLSHKFPKDKDLFLSFVKENQDYLTQIERAYYGVITDAFEGCFAFRINAEDYNFEIDLKEEVSYGEALAKAIELEEKMIKFYSDAAEQSKSLMADVPRAFRMIAKKRDSRLIKFTTMINERKGLLRKHL